MGSCLIRCARVGVRWRVRAGLRWGVRGVGLRGSACGLGVVGLVRGRLILGGVRVALGWFGASSSGGVANAVLQRYACGCVGRMTSRVISSPLRDDGVWGLTSGPLR